MDSRFRPHAVRRHTGFVLGAARLRTRVVGGLLVALGLCTGQPLASAQQFALEQYHPAPVPTDGFGVSRAVGLEHLELGAQLQLAYGHDPLLVRVPGGGRALEVKHHLVGHAAFSLGLFDRLTLFAGLPVQLVMKGDTGPTDGAGLGDAWLGGRFTLLGGAGTMFALGSELIARMPSAKWSDRSQHHSGDESGTYDLGVTGEVRVDRFVFGLRPGVRLREPQRIDNRLRIGHELLFSGFAQMRVVKSLHLTAELYGNSPFQQFFQKRSTPIEMLFGLKGRVGDFLLGAAAGPGLTNGYAAADYRVVGSLGYTHKTRSAPRDLDADHDGVLEPWDLCPNEPEDWDGFQDQDGCPDIDNDEDGVPDSEDRCPNEAEDRDGFADEDGCPDPDNDGDEIPDAEDKCPLQTEDKDGFEDEDGCLDYDNDGDGVPDAQDKCPDTAGVIELEGCPVPEPPPPEPAAVLEKGEIRIKQRIEFAENKDALLPESTPVLEAVRDVLNANPEVLVLRVEGHTDSRGAQARNMLLSRKRAESVTRWLIEHGVDKARLNPVGCGPKRPIEPNITADNRRKNRRVEFHLAEPAPAEPVDASMCQAASQR